MSDHQRSFAVVTGGSNGIGFELARQFLANGFDVLIAAQDEAHLREAAGRLSSGGGTVTCWAGDLGREDQVASLHAAIGSTGRPVDALCVNAGFGLGGPFAETDLQRELSMIDINVRGAVQLTKLVLKDMVARMPGGSCSPPPLLPPCRTRSRRCTAAPRCSCAGSAKRCMRS